MSEIQFKHKETLFHKVEQGSYQWHCLRKDFITGSRLTRLMGKSTFDSEVSNVLARRMKAEPDEPGFISPAMEWGTDNEPYARTSYEMQSGNNVDEIGFVTRGKIAGISPDGVIWNTEDPDGPPIGAIEIICPDTGNHIHSMRMSKTAPAKRWQISYYFYVMPSIQWLDFVSFDPRLSGKELFIKRITRKDVHLDLDLIEIRMKEAESIITNFETN